MQKQLLLSSAVILLLGSNAAIAGEQHDIHHEHHAGLHFSHPVISESPSPDTKLKLSYSYAKKPGHDGEEGSRLSTISLEGEYAFNRSFSVEVSVPYSHINHKEDGEDSAENLGNIEVGLKYANYHFEEYGLLLGGGLEFGLPTGDSDKEIGSSHVLEIAPFLDFGYKFNDFELIGFLEFGFPTNKNGEDEADLELGLNLSLQHNTTNHFKLSFEIDGEKVYEGEEDGHEVVNLTPGFKYLVPNYTGLEFSAGVSFPITDDKEFYVMPTANIAYHF